MAITVILMDSSWILSTTGVPEFVQLSPALLFFFLFNIPVDVSPLAHTDQRSLHVLGGITLDWKG